MDTAEIRRRFVAHFEAHGHTAVPSASLLLDDASIRDAQRLLWQSFKLAVEPAAALPLAALRSGAWRPREAQRVCLIVCGANVDPATLA